MAIEVASGRGLQPCRNLTSPAIDSECEETWPAGKGDCFRSSGMRRGGMSSPRQRDPEPVRAVGTDPIERERPVRFAGGCNVGRGSDIRP